MRKRRRPAPHTMAALKLALGAAAILTAITFWMTCISGCASLPAAATSSDSDSSAAIVEKLDLAVTINGVDYPGWGVVETADKYEVTVQASQDIGRMQWRTCDRSDEIDRGSKGFWGDLFGPKDTTFTFSYLPDATLDKKHHCPLEIDVLTPKKEFNAFAILEFKDQRPEYLLPATVVCNGSKIAGKGVAMCRAREALMQSITFDRPVMVGKPSPECDVMKDVDGKMMNFQFSMPRGKCLFTFGADATAANGEHLSLRFFTYGYNDVPVRGDP